MIKITLNKELDKETFLNFFELKAGGVDFGKKIKDTHYSIDSENYEEYIDNYYDENHEELINALEDINNSLQRSTNSFFNAVKDVFNQDFSEKEYVGALSIFDCNPRYLDKNIFQVYYIRDTQDKLGVIFHEVLHFIFFDYCDNTCSELVKNLDKNSGAYWDLSEIFNVIILNQPAFKEILGKSEMVFYPNHKEIYPTIERVWNENNGDIKKFVEDSLKILQK